MPTTGKKKEKKEDAYFGSVLFSSSCHHSFNVYLCCISEVFKRLTSVFCLDMQVLDARDPQGTRCYHLERHLKEHKHKHMVLLLNKVSNYIILSENPFLPIGSFSSFHIKIEIL